MANSSSGSGLQFDLMRMTAEDFHNLVVATRVQDIKALAAVMAKVVTTCPPKWGQPDDPQTYLKLPYLGEFQDVLGGMTSAVEDYRKNSGAPSTTS